MKKIAVLLMLALAAAPVFSQQIQELKPQGKESFPMKEFKANVKTAVSGSTYKISKRESTIRELTFLYKDIRKIPSTDEGAILAKLYQFAGWYEQKRANNPKSVIPVAMALGIPLQTQDVQSFTAYSFVQMHLSEIASEGKVRDRFASVLGWTEDILPKAAAAEDVMATWKDHLREDAVKGGMTVKEPVVSADYTNTREFQVVRTSLDAFRQTCEEQTAENKDFVLQNILINVADPLFEQYAENPADKGTFTVKDPKAFAAIKAEINKPVKVGWQRKPIQIRQYVVDNLDIVHNWASPEPAGELHTFIRILK